MNVKHKDSGTSGRYLNTPDPFSSISYAKYSPEKRDILSIFYSNLRKWRYETLALSSADEILKNPALGAIIEMGDDVVPLIIDELRVRPDLLVAALTLITGENPVPDDARGDIQKMAFSWIDWYENTK